MMEHRMPSWVLIWAEKSLWLIRKCWMQSEICWSYHPQYTLQSWERDREPKEMLDHDFMIWVERCSDFDDCWLLCSRLVHHPLTRLWPWNTIYYYDFLCHSTVSSSSLIFCEELTPNSSGCIPVKALDLMHLWAAFCILHVQSSAAGYVPAVGLAGRSLQQLGPVCRRGLCCSAAECRCLLCAVRARNVNRSLRTVHCLNPWVECNQGIQDRIAEDPWTYFLRPTLWSTPGDASVPWLASPCIW